ncbi:SDR family oxidoreductase [Mesorhizobium kowhaii]|uniref:SDR family oxidoreductase n=1 Tax=Mesorhizobium kowhaii TaxID=1300272 RepID=UPI0035EB7C90
MTDKVIALVTGANKGLGKEVARQLGKRGMRVYVGSRDQMRGEATVAELVADDLDAHLLPLDVTSDESVTAAADILAEHEGYLDVLVNNAGILAARPAFEIDAADMSRTYETNVFGVVRMIHTMLPLLRRSQQPRIVNIASTTASLTLASDPTTMFGREDTIVAYASSKAAVTMLTVQYGNAFRRSADHAHFKINTATPGYIATDLNNFSGNRTVEEGATIVVDLATLPDDGPSGGYFNDAGVVPW